MKRKKGGTEAIKRRYAYLFVSPWIFGIVIFVLIPLVQCFYYSLSDVKMTTDGLLTSFAGLKYYKYLFIEDAYYTDMIFASLSSLLTSIPLVIALSMIIAIVLNQKFKGRMIARAIFFLPVIITSGVVMKIVSGFGMQSSVVDPTAAEQSVEYIQAIDFSAILENLNMPDQINRLLQQYLSNTFNIIWSCGVQILLFVAGLQTIPEQLYEVGKIEGITAWEEFWFVTVPLMGRIILLVLFYTMVDLFITQSTLINSVVNTINQQKYSEGSAMIWPYFLLVGAVMGIVVVIYNRLCLKRWE